MGTTDQEGVKYRVEVSLGNSGWVKSNVDYYSGPFHTQKDAWAAIHQYITTSPTMKLSDYRVVEIREGAAPPPSPSPEKDMKVSKAEKKPPWFLLPFAALIGVLRVFAYGVKKYAKGNWRNATLADGAGDRYLSASLRHMTALQRPNCVVDGVSLAALDEESGLPHLDHAICGLIMLRGILTKEGVLPEDPGEGNDPGKA